MNLIVSKIEFIEIKTSIKGSRDQNDNFLLSLSYDGKADYLVTGDLDLLVLKRTGSTYILTLNEFLQITSLQTQ